jgi:hypothetical protein
MAKSAPPLAIQVLEEVENIEIQLQEYLSRCKEPQEQYYSDSPFNMDKATRILRSLGARAFEVQASYYISLEDCCSEWIEDIQSSTVKSCIGVARRFATETQVPSLEWELTQTLDGYARKYKAQITELVADASQAKMIRKRLTSSVTSFRAAKRMDDFCASNAIAPKEFAGMARTTTRTLYTFRTTGTVSIKVLDRIASAMGISRVDLLKEI